MNKTKTGLILAMSILVMCTLVVPAIAQNVTDAECGGCFGAMPPEITEIQTATKDVSISSKGEVVIWGDDFSTDPFSSGRWSTWTYLGHYPGWNGDYVSGGCQRRHERNIARCADDYEVARPWVNLIIRKYN